VQKIVLSKIVMKSVLFLIFVNELPDWIVSSMIMFADDAKVWTVVDCLEDSTILQADLDRLIRWSHWSETWLISVK